MKLISILICFTLSTESISGQGNPNFSITHASSAFHDRPQVVPGLVIIKLRPTVRIDPGAVTVGVPSLDKLLAQFGPASISPLDPMNRAWLLNATQSTAPGISKIFIVRYTAGLTPQSAAAILMEDPAVEYAEPYYVFPVQSLPNDSLSGSQWAIKAMKLDSAWSVTTGDSTIIIGDVDSGVDWMHEDLKDNVFINRGEWGTNGELSANGIDDDGNGLIDDYRGWDFIGSGTVLQPRPDNDPVEAVLQHGTLTSGCAAARTNNRIGIAGSSYRSKFIPIKVNGDARIAIEAGLQGIIYAADMGCKIINCSWGGADAQSKALQDVVDYVYSKGALVVAASGNNFKDNDVNPLYPSSLLHVLNVGAIDSLGNVTEWSTFGASVQVWAPGKNIMTTLPRGKYGQNNGTSFATPLAAGVAALVWSVHPDWTPDQVAKQIRVTSDHNAVSPDPKRFGTINAYRAVTVNRHLNETPGILLKSYNVTTPTGNRITRLGETAHVEFELENVLAPTSAAAMVSIASGDSVLEVNESTLAIGALPTFGTRSFAFDATMSASTLLSEGIIPVLLTITDGEYLDYLVVRVEISLPNTWNKAFPAGELFFSSLYAQSPSVVWGTASFAPSDIPVSDVCYRTVDAGSQWRVATGTGFPSGKRTTSIWAADSVTAFIGTGPLDGKAEIYRTTDGGDSWVGVDVSTITSFVRGVHFFDANHGLFVGDPKEGRWGIGLTSDGGLLWSAAGLRPDATGGEHGWSGSCSFIGDHGWFGTNRGRIFRTTDRGITWMPAPTAGVNSVELSFRDERIGTARYARRDSTGEDALAVTDDGGISWKPVSTIQMKSFPTMVMERGGLRWWVLMGGNAYVTLDLGLTWAMQARPAEFVCLIVSSFAKDSVIATAWSAGIDIYSLKSRLATAIAGNPPVAGSEDITIDAIHPIPMQSYPGSLIVEFTIGKSGLIEGMLYDFSGRSIKSVFASFLAAGAHTTNIDLSGMAAGVYYLKIASAGSMAVRPIILSR